MSDQVSRRDFVKLGLCAAAGISTLPQAFAAGSQGKIERRSDAKRIIVMGAGLAGLAAAYET